MQNSNNSRYIILSALFVFASIKEVYAETEITEEPGTNIQTEQLLNEPLLLVNLSEEITVTNENDKESASEPEILPEIIIAEAPSYQEPLSSEQQEQLFNSLVNSLSPEEQEQFIELLEEAALDLENNNEKNEEQSELLENLFEQFDTARCVGFCFKLALTIACWELIQKHDLVENNRWLPKSCPELFKLFTGVLLLDDVKDFIKEFKKAVEKESRSLYKSLFPTTKTA